MTLPLTWQAAAVDDDGASVAFVLPDVPDDAPHDVREGIARRRLVALSGACPCGATMRLPNRADRRAAARSGAEMRLTVEHENDCAAVDGNLATALRRWSR